MNGLSGLRRLGIAAPYPPRLQRQSGTVSLTTPFLAPDIQYAILKGQQPLHLNLETLKKTQIPLAWSKQRNALGFVEPGTACSAEQIP